MRKLSEQAQEKTKDTIKAIYLHPFVQQLSNGSLSAERFSFYLKQDFLYLQDFMKCNSLLAAKASKEHALFFVQHSQRMLAEEVEQVHSFYLKEEPLASLSLTPATLCYTSYLLKVCSFEPIEIGIAAILPCFWIYHQVGGFLQKHVTPENPFYKWVETYSQQDFGHHVSNLIDVFDALGKASTQETKEKMLDAFYKSSLLEWHFWNDAYHKTRLDGFMTSES